MANAKRSNPRKKKNDLVPILVIGGAVVLYFYLTRKRAIITVGPMSDPTWNAAEDYTPPGYEQPYQANPFPSILDNDLWMSTNTPGTTLNQEFNYPEPGGGSSNDEYYPPGSITYYQQIQGEVINGATRRRSRIRGVVPVTS